MQTQILFNSYSYVYPRGGQKTPVQCRVMQSFTIMAPIYSMNINIIGLARVYTDSEALFPNWILVLSLIACLGTVVWSPSCSMLKYVLHLLTCCDLLLNSGIPTSLRCR